MATAVCSALLALAGGNAASAAPADLTLEKDRLPGFQPASADTAEMTEAEEREWQRAHRTAFRSATRSSDLDGKTRQEIELGTQHFVDLMTMPEKAGNLPEVADEVLNAIDVFAKGAVKDFLLEEYARRLLKLLYHEQTVVRVNAVHTLGRLNEDPGSRAGGSPRRPYWPVYRALLSVIEDPARTPAEKVRAADGLSGIMLTSGIPRGERDDVIKRTSAALAAAIDPANIPTAPSQLETYWYWPYRLAALLGDVKSPMTLNREPDPVAALVKLAKDPERHWLARSQAVRSISQLRLDDDSRFNLPALAKLTTSLTAEMVADFNKDPNRSYWRRAFANLYFAFKPVTREQAEDGFGLLALADTGTFRKDAAAIREAFAVVEPVMVEIGPMNPGDLKRISNDTVDALTAYVTENPADQPVHPSIR